MKVLNHTLAPLTIMLPLSSKTAEATGQVAASGKNKVILVPGKYRNPKDHGQGIAPGETVVDETVWKALTDKKVSPQTAKNIAVRIQKRQIEVVN